MSASAILEFKDVSKSFGRIKALNNVSFEVGKGDFVFIVGPSGAGKTTLLRLLMAEISPTSGEIIFAGKNISNLKKSEVPFLRQTMGIVFQDFKLLSDRTVYENVAIALAVKGVSESHWGARVNKILKEVGLLERSDLFPSQLSGGEIQRVALARALVVEPDIIFADEPTGNLDWETADSIMDLFVKINKEGKTVIVSTHNKEIIDKLGKRVIKLKDGKIVK